MTLILVIDDEAAILDLLQQFLVEEGYDIVTAHDGREGLHCLSEEPPNLVLSDVMMPFLNGPDLARVIEGNAAFREIPVVLMSAGGRTAIGADVPHAAFVPKPFDLDTLLATLTRVLKEHRDGTGGTSGS